MHVFVLGRFPPPLDGQSLATRRLAELMESAHAVHRVNIEPRGTAHIAAEVRFRWSRFRHYLGLRKPIRTELKAHPTAAVLWTSISPAPLGHWRDMLTVLPALQTDQPVYGVSHRATYNQVFESPLTRMTALRLVDRLNGIVFLSDAIAERCGPWIPAQKRFVIPNTIDDEIFCTDAEVASGHSRSDSAPLRLLFLSNMMPEKGYMEILEAVRLLRDQGVAVRVDFAGGWVADADREAFQGFVASHRLGDRVLHHGSLNDRSEVKSLYLQADVFLLPTYHPTEGQPISIIEALNAGTPVITTRHGGIPEMVRENQEALFVEPRNPRAIAEAVASLRDLSRWRSLSNRGRQRFIETFSPDVIRRKWERLLSR